MWSSCLRTLSILADIVYLISIYTQDNSPFNIDFSISDMLKALFMSTKNDQTRYMLWTVTQLIGSWRPTAFLLPNVWSFIEYCNVCQVSQTVGYVFAWASCQIRQIACCQESLLCHWHQWTPEITWWRHQMETLSALLDLCAGNSPVNGEFPLQRPITRSFDVSLICAWINGWVNNCEAGDLRRHRAHYDVIVMKWSHMHYVHDHYLGGGPCAIYK